MEGQTSTNQRTVSEASQHAAIAGRDAFQLPAPSGTSKRVKLRATLLERARATFGDSATALDYVCAWVGSGRSVTCLAAEMAADMGESCSRGFLSLIIHRLAPDATARIAAARLDGSAIHG